MCEKKLGSRDYYFTMCEKKLGSRDYLCAKNSWGVETGNEASIGVSHHKTSHTHTQCSRQAPSRWPPLPQVGLGGPESHGGATGVRAGGEWGGRLRQEQPGSAAVQSGDPVSLLRSPHDRGLYFAER